MAAQSSGARIRTNICAQAKRTGDQTITHDTETTISWQAEDYDTSSIWAAGDPTKLVLPYAGDWEVWFHAEWTQHATGVRRVTFAKNGVVDNTGRLTMATAGGAMTTAQTLRHVVRGAAVNDYLTAVVYHTAGEDLALSFTNTRFGARFLGA